MRLFLGVLLFATFSSFVSAGPLPCAVLISGYIAKTNYNSQNCPLFCAAEMSGIRADKRCACISSCLTRCVAEYEGANNDLNACNMRPAPQVEPQLKVEDVLR